MSIELAQLKFPSIAQDLAIMSMPDSPIENLDAVCRAHQITRDELSEIIKIPKFQELFANSLAEFRAQGSQAVVQYRTASLAQALSEKIFRDAMQDKVEAKDSVKFLELLMRASGQLDTKDKSVNTQVNVGINIPVPKGLNNPKLRHMQEPS